MSHYFINDETMIKNRRVISFRFLDIDYKLISDDGIFSKEGFDKGTESLLKVVSTLNLKGEVCDLGSGIGVIGVILNDLFDVKMTGFDVNKKAVELANDNYSKYKVNGQNILNDGIKGKFDWVISNPPIRVGKEVMYRLFEEAYESLNKAGSFVFVIRKQHGAKSAQAKCIELFGNCELLKKDKGYYIYKAEKQTD